MFDRKITSRDSSLNWLIRSRWAVLLGLAASIPAASFYLAGTFTFNFETPLFLAVGAVLVLVVCVSQIFLHRSYGKRKEQLKRLEGAALILDVFLLTYILYYTGGHTNPFSMLYLIYVVLAALLLGSLWTWSITIVSSVCYAFLFNHHVPLEHFTASHHAFSNSGFDIHLEGMLIAFIAIAALVSGFLARMKSEMDEREREIARMRLNAEKLAAVSTISASIAHELGSPLTAMLWMVEEMKDELSANATPETRTFVKDMLEQLERCTEAVSRINQSSAALFEDKEGTFELSEVYKTVRNRICEVGRARLVFESYPGPIVLMLPQAGLIHVLFSVTKNALEASDKPVTVVSQISKGNLLLVVSDQGTGMTKEQIRRIGEPFFTTKHTARGMGLGLFISKLYVDRLGGSLSIQSEVGKGTVVRIELPCESALRKVA
jgi:two-component system, sensor histidine kinase RegB